MLQLKKSPKCLTGQVDGGAQSASGLLRVDAADSGDFQVLTLTETSVNSGVFTAAVNVSAENSGVNQTGLYMSDCRMMWQASPLLFAMSIQGVAKSM